VRKGASCVLDAASSRADLQDCARRQPPPICALYGAHAFPVSNPYAAPRSNGAAADCGAKEPDVMSDFIFLGLGLAGFVLMLVYARICARL
jgi:hypothetical protein